MCQKIGLWVMINHKRPFEIGYEFILGSANHLKCKFYKVLTLESILTFLAKIIKSKGSKTL